MIENYKETLLRYLTGNLTRENKKSTLNYSEVITKDSSIDLGTNFYILGYIAATDSKGNPNGKTIVYGEIGSGGFIAVFEGSNLLYYTTKYNTGTSFGQFKKLEIDEKGQLYGIDRYRDKYRIILLNNISELNKKGEQQVVLRQSYFLQGATQLIEPNYTWFYIKKSLQSANYLIIGITANNPINIMAVTRFKINVGASNEWEDLPVTATVPQNTYLVPKNAYIYFDKKDNPQLEIYTIESVGGQDGVVWYSNNENEVSSRATLIPNLRTTFFSNGGMYGGQEILPTEPGKFYMFLSGYENVSSNKKQVAWVIEYSGGEWTNERYITSTVASASFDFIPQATFVTVDNMPMLYCIFPVEPSRQDFTNEGYQFAMIIDGRLSVTSNLPHIKYTGGINQIALLFSKVFNMLQLGSVYYDGNDQQKTSIWQLVYNSQNYNNRPYENINSLVANNGMLFDSQNNLIFARNLYNYKVYNNRVISVLNVPNVYLNDTEIASEKLLSETNSDIITTDNSITKNIYEDLYINFFTQTNMSNQNEPIFIDNKGGAIRITQSAFKSCDYEEAKATKVRINYTDGTELISGATATITNGVATYKITVYVPNNKNIETIDILSQDENTVYQTISNLNLQNNKYYDIKQDVHIE